MKTVAIVQARMASTRLPGKILADLAGSPMLAHVIRRARRAHMVDLVVVATTTASTDDAVEEYCEANGVAYFRGDEQDVLSRYRAAASAFGADVIARLTADCPFVDPSVIDRVIGEFRGGRLDYVSNTIHPTYPDGLDVEVFSSGALVRSDEEAMLASEREHVTPFMKKHPELFRLRSVERAEDLSAMRWTVDEPADLAFARQVCERMGSADFEFDDLVAMLRSDPALARINEGIERNAGYAKSLLQDER